jgi:hypothetical protein
LNVAKKISLDPTYTAVAANAKEGTDALGGVVVVNVKRLGKFAPAQEALSALFKENSVVVVQSDSVFSSESPVSSDFDFFGITRRALTKLARSGADARLTLGSSSGSSVISDIELRKGLGDLANAARPIVFVVDAETLEGSFTAKRISMLSDSLLMKAANPGPLAADDLFTSINGAFHKSNITVFPNQNKSDIEKAIEEAMVIGSLHKRLNDPDLSFVDFTEIAKANLTAEEIGACKTAEQVKTAVMAKAKMSAANMDRLQAAHDHLVAMGADCDGDADKSTPATLQKVAALEKTMTTALAKLAVLEALPMPHPIQLRTVTKVETTKKADTPADDDISIYGDKPITWFEKMADGVSIDWEASRKKLEQAGA